MRAVARGCARPPLIGIFLSRPVRDRTLDEAYPGAVDRDEWVTGAFGAGNDRGVELIDRTTE